MNHPNFIMNGNSLNVANPLFGQSLGMLNTGLGNTPGASFNPLYQIGGPRSIQLSLKVVF
jgi:hypothetical protein